MEKKELKNLPTSALLDRLHTEARKQVPDEIVVSEIEEELDSRLPFKSIEARIEGEEGHEGKIKRLEKEIKECKKMLTRHSHKENNVVVKLEDV